MGKESTGWEKVQGYSFPTEVVKELSDYTISILAVLKRRGVVYFRVPDSLQLTKDDKVQIEKARIQIEDLVEYGYFDICYGQSRGYVVIETDKFELRLV